MANYKTLELYPRNEPIADTGGFDVPLIVKDDHNDSLTKTNLESFKIFAIFTDNGYRTDKYDSNYPSGADTQISVDTNGVVTVHILNTDIYYWDGLYWLEVYLVDKTTGNQWVTYHRNFRIKRTILR